jgi:hypothetical protein
METRISINLATLTGSSVRKDTGLFMRLEHVTITTDGKTTSDIVIKSMTRCVITNV